MLRDIVPADDHRELERYDPDAGLKSIAVAEAAEKHFQRARDAAKLFEAIQHKLTAQARYVVWRDSVVLQGRPRKNRSTAIINLPEADPGDKIAHRWRKRFCSQPDTGTVIDASKMAAALKDAQQRCLRICEATDGYAKATFTGEFEWYTPPKYIALARAVLGDIDLDPATSEQAQKTVQAARYYTLESDGLKQEWHGRVWLKPPLRTAANRAVRLETRRRAARATRHRGDHAHAQLHRQRVVSRSGLRGGRGLLHPRARQVL
jgi:hypothetical protein